MGDVLFESISEELKASRKRIKDLEAEIERLRGIEDVVQKTKEKLQIVSRAISCAVYTALPDEPSTTLFLTGNIEELSGYSADDFIEDPGLWSDIIHENDRERVLKALGGHRGKKSDFDIKYRICKKNGSTIWIRDRAAPVLDSDGNIIRINGCMEDINRRMCMEELLRRSEERYRLLVENANEVILVQQAGHLVFFNHMAIDFTGYTRDELHFTPFERFVHPDDRDMVIQRYQKRLNGHKNGERYNLRIIKKDGSWAWVEASSVGVDWNYKPAVLCFLVDITDRIKAEEERLMMLRRSHQVQKLESLGVMAGGIAHDFNNILSAIIGNIELVEMDLETDKAAMSNLQESKKAALKAADLTNQILAYTGKARFVTQRVNLNGLIEDIDHKIQEIVPENIELQKRLDPGLPVIIADPSKMKQVIINLIMNASEAVGFMDGEICISTSCMDCDDETVGDVMKGEMPLRGRYVALDISDNGPGMDESTIQRLFDPFFTTKFTGRGLGLPVVQGIVKGHKGRVIVESKQYGGARFRILFPVPEQESAREIKSEAESRVRKRSHDREHIMVVDDEEMVRNVCSKMLERSGFTVCTADSGKKAVEIFQKNKDDISCIVLDLTMPGMDGIATLKQLKGMDPGVRVILSSGYTIEEATRMFSVDGLSGYIQKPYSRNELIDIVTDISRDEKVDDQGQR